jgi:hypothetical protein
LDRDDGAVTDRTHQRMVELVDCAVVIAADRRHGDQLSLDEFDVVAFTQNADLAHPVIFGHRDRAARYPRIGGQEAWFVEHGHLLGVGGSKIGWAAEPDNPAVRHRPRPA